MADIDSFRHRFCRSKFIEQRKRLKIRHRDIDVIQFRKNDSHWEVHLPKEFTPGRYGNMGTFTGCCKWSAGFECMVKIKNET